MTRVPVPLPDASWPSVEQAEGARLFRPIRVGPLTARSRTWVPAMVPWRATNDGFVTNRNLDWYARFAAGQPGVLVAEATGIRDIPSGPLLRIGHDRFVPGMKRLTERVKEASKGQTRFLLQIIDFLRVNRRPQPETYFQRYFKPTAAHRWKLANLRRDSGWRTASDDDVASAVAAATPAEHLGLLSAREHEALHFGYRETVNDTHLPHIRSLPVTLPTLFADASDRAVRAGFDGVELHFAHAYTMSSFLSRTNVRSDDYGGTQARRMALPLEVIQAVRERVGHEVCVGARFLGDDVVEGGSRIEDAVAYGRAFAAAGLDFLSLSKGGRFEDAKRPRVGHAIYPYTGESGHECMPTTRIGPPGPFGRNIPLARAVRDAVRADGHETPIVAAGGICTFDQAEAALKDGHADLIAAARQSLADPDWFRKMALGRGSEIRRCTYTNYCEGLDQAHKEVTCKLWDKIGLRGADPVPNDIPRTEDGKRRLLPPAWDA